MPKSIQWNLKLSSSQQYISVHILQYIFLICNGIYTYSSSAEWEI